MQTQNIQPKILFSPNVEEIPGAGILICTEAPYFVGKPIRFNSMYHMDMHIKANCQKTKAGFVPGYRMIIAFIGTIDNMSSEPIVSEEWPKNANFYLDLMAQWYLEKVVKKEHTRLKKFLIEE